MQSVVTRKGDISDGQTLANIYHQQSVEWRSLSSLQRRRRVLTKRRRLRKHVYLVSNMYWTVGRHVRCSRPRRRRPRSDRREAPAGRRQSEKSMVASKAAGRRPARPTDRQTAVSWSRLGAVTDPRVNNWTQYPAAADVDRRRRRTVGATRAGAAAAAARSGSDGNRERWVSGARWISQTDQSTTWDRRQEDLWDPARTTWPTSLLLLQLLVVLVMMLVAYWWQRH